MGSLLSPLAQLVLGVFMAPPGRPGTGALHKLLVGLLGLAAAALIGSVALVILTFALVIWVLPPGATTLEISLLTAAILLLAALLIWQLTSRGQTPHEILEDALEPHYSPLDSLARSARKVLHSFERGWHHG